MGRLGSTLAILLREAGHSVRCRRRGDPPPEAEVAWLTVRDDAIAEVAAGLPPHRAVLHSSGILGVEALRPHRPAACLHPVQTFPGPGVAIPSLSGVVATVSGDPEAVELAEELAVSLGMTPARFEGDRALYHAACVLAGNLAPLLVAEARAAIVKAGVHGEAAGALLSPLVHAAVENMLGEAGSRAATGPWARGDVATITRHREALAHDPELLAIYDALGQRAAAGSLGGCPSLPAHIAALLGEERD